MPESVLIAGPIVILSQRTDQKVRSPTVTSALPLFTSISSDPMLLREQGLSGTGRRLPQARLV